MTCIWNYGKNIALLTMVLLLFSGGAYGSTVDLDMFKKASVLISNGKYLEATGLYNKISNSGETNDSRADALLFAGTVYDLYLDQPEISLKIYKKIYTKFPDSSASPDAFFMSGRILFQMEKYQEAYDTFKIYSEMYPASQIRRSTSIWMNKAKGYFIDVPDKIKKLVLPLDKEIRVLLKKNVPSIVFSSPADIRISNLTTGKTIFFGTGPVVVAKKAGMIVVNSEKTSAKQCKIETDNEFLNLGGKRYRGKFLVHSGRRGLTAVNHLHIEKYLYGVVPKEMSWLWSEEALKAQAIASRTYALHIKSKQPSYKNYDLVATTASQVYGGYSSEKQKTSQAVDKTFGKVMVFDDQLIISYFHANSGGQTESSKNVWGGELAYLQSASDQFSSIPEARKWRLSLTYKELEKLLVKSGLKIGKIKKIKLEGRSKSGRIKAFRIISDMGSARLSGNNFRLKIGPVELKSTWFDVKKEKNKLVFRGRGYGHGVGMSQWGAHQMALADYSYDKILKHYYKGIDIAEAAYR